MVRLDQATVDSKGHGRCPVLTVRLVEDVGEVSGNCFLAEDQLLGDL